jgi:hypothetical protein
MVLLMRCQLLWVWLGLFMVGCGGSGGGDADGSFVSLHDNPEWTFVKVDGAGSYGTKKFKVPARQSWVNTGVFLNKDEKFTIKATGNWSLDKESLTAAGNPEDGTAEKCNVGQLVGWINNDKTLICLGESGTFTASAAGILFIGMHVDFLQKESLYKLRSLNKGYLDVEVTATTAATVPLFEYPDLNTFDYNDVKSGWVELATRSIVITIPKELAIQDKDNLQAAMKRLQRFYDEYYNLRQVHAWGTKEHPEPIRFIADSSYIDGDMALGLNPIRMPSQFMKLDDKHRITQVGSNKNRPFWKEYALALARNFLNQPKTFSYSSFFPSAWSELFVLHAQRQMKLKERILDCSKIKKDYLADTTKKEADVLKGGSLGYCFLLEIYDKHGFEFYQKFYKTMDDRFKDDTQDSYRYGIEFLKEDFTKAAGNKDVNSILTEWKFSVQDD